MFQSLFPEVYPDQPSPQRPGVSQGLTAQSETANAPDTETNTLGEEGVTGISDDYSARISAIQQKYASSSTYAADVEVYIREADREARTSELKALLQADAEFTPNWRRAGLPVKGSHLELDGERMAGARLVNPRAIVDAYGALIAREVKSPPRTLVYADRTLAPHYFATTNNTRVRSTMLQDSMGRVEMQRTREGEVVSMRREAFWSPPREERTRKTVDDEVDVGSLAPGHSGKMPPEQWKVEKKIIKNMNSKLAFLRNPRYPLPPQVKMLMEGEWRKGDGSLKPYVPRMLTAPTQTWLTSKEATEFLVEPAEVVFDEYDMGLVLEKVVKLRNVSPGMRSLRIIPPQSQYFHTSQPRYPTESSLLAPGMHCEVIVRFCPDSLADYEDSFAVDTLVGRQEVVLKARRPPPIITLDAVFDVGDVVLGRSRTITFPFQNIGGRARFWLLRSQDWPQRAGEARQEKLEMGPFVMWPTFLEVNENENTELHVHFNPSASTEFSERLIMVCNNCHIREFTIRGRGVGIDIRLSDIDQKVVDDRDMRTPLWFGEVTVGATHTRYLHIRNDTLITFPFRWRYTGGPTTPLIPPLDPASISAREPPPQDSVVDIVKLGLGEVDVFKVAPQEGEVQPGETVEVSVTFRPTKLERYVRWAHMLVALPERTGVEGEKAPEVPVVEVGFEGVGNFRLLEAMPSVVAIKGTLQPGQRIKRRVTLLNPTAAPVPFELEGMTDLVQAEPVNGVVPAHGQVVVDVTVRPIAAGPLSQTLLCRVKDGVPLPIRIIGNVVKPHVELDMESQFLDFGLVYSGITSELPVVLKTNSSTASCNWRLREMFVPAKGGVTPSGAKGTHLSFQPDHGVLGPGDRPRVVVTCHAEGEGKYHGVLECSGEGYEPRCIRVYATVVLPRVVVEPNVLDLGTTYVGVQLERSVRLRNISQLPAVFWFNETLEGDQTAMDVAVDPAFAELAPGESIVANLRMHPRTIGHCQLAAVCHVERNTPPTGLLLTSNVKGLDVTYRVLHPADPHQLKSLMQQPLQATSRSASVTDMPTPHHGSHVADGSWSHLNNSRPDSPHPAMTTLSTLPGLPPEVAHGRQTAALRQQRLEGEAGCRSVGYLEADFGGDVPLGDQRQMHIVVTNHTAMTATVDAWLERFGVEAGSLPCTPLHSGPTGGIAAASAGLGASLSGTALGHNMAAGALGSIGGTRSKSAPAPRRHSNHQTTASIPHDAPITLTDTHEKTTPFWSASGNRMMAARRMQEDSQKLLGGKGLAIAVLPGVVELRPWCSAVLTLLAHNDMCGDYLDTLTVQVGDCDAVKVPVRIGVVGTPLVVQQERALIKGLREQRPWRTYLEYGQLPSGVQQERTFYVFNTGCLDMRLAWQFMRYMEEREISEAESAADAGTSAAAADSAAQDSAQRSAGEASKSGASAPARKLVEVKLVCDPCGVKVVVSRRSKPDGQPYVVTPSEALIHAGGSAWFTVSFLSDQPRHCSGFLHGVQQVVAEEQPISLQLWGAGTALHPLKTQLTGSFHANASVPPLPLQDLRVDLHAHVVASHLAPEPAEDLAWVCHSIHSAKSHPSYQHTVTLVNTATCPLCFTLQTEGPFELMTSTPSIAQDTKDWQGVVGVPRTLGSSSTLLPPRESVSTSLRFLPAPREGPSAFNDYRLEGTLHIQYSNGDRQTLTLDAQVLHPRVTASVATLDFGSVHFKSCKQLEVTLSNPTQVDAYWAVAEEGQAPALPRPGKADVPPGGEIKAGPFVVSPSSGMLPGRGLTMPKTVQLRVMFQPPAAAAANPRLVVHVVKGSGCRVVLNGQGSFDERSEADLIAALP